MLWVISRDYKPDTAATRASILQVHREYIHGHEDTIVLAGALQDDAGTQDTGTMLTLNVGSRAEAQAFHDNDPYTKAGVFDRVTITRMRKGRLKFGAAEAT
jgi:uncharacterized protein YciI